MKIDFYDNAQMDRSFSPVIIPLENFSTDRQPLQLLIHMVTVLVLYCQVIQSIEN